MTLELYYVDLAPPCRAVLLVGKALGLDFNLKVINLFENEQKSSNYLKLNPQHTVPTLVDSDFTLWDSHAIAAYLVSKYGKDDSLYPKDLKLRAVVDQRLHFDSGILYPRLRGITAPILYDGKKTIDSYAISGVEEAYKFMEKFLENSDWIAGDQMTIADFCCVPTITSLEVLVPGIAKYPKLSSWCARCKKSMIGYEEANQNGLNVFDKVVKSALSKL